MSAPTWVNTAIPTAISDDAAQHDLAGADLVGQQAGDRHGQHRADALRREQQAGVQGGLAADLQEVASGTAAWRRRTRSRTATS